MIDLTPPGRRARPRRRAVAGEIFEAYRERAAADELERLPLGSRQAPDPPAAPLGGIPVAVKDLFCVEGVPSAAGSRILEGYRPAYTATRPKLAGAGAPMLGKTNMDEFAMGSSNENSGFGPVQNPWDRERVPGGSSGGSAAAVAAGLAPWAIGTDTGGSIRQPAALCGIVGLKPTYGAVSRYGMIAFASSLDQAGPLTRDVKDAALLFRHMVGRDPCDSTSLDLPGELGSRPRSASTACASACPPTWTGGAASSPAWRRSSRDARQDRGARRRGRGDRAAQRRSRPLGLLPARARGGQRQPGPLRRRALRDAERQRRPALDVRGDPRRRLRRRGQAPHHARHLRALVGLLRRPVRQGAAGAHQDRRGLRESVREGGRDRHADLTQRRLQARRAHRRPVLDVPLRLLHGADAAGRHPGPLDPGGLSDGLPVGIQLAGPAFSEGRLLDAGHALEQAIGFDGSPARG